MVRLINAIIGLSTFVILVSCASQKMVDNTPPPKFEPIVLAKAIDDSGMLGIPVEPTTDFTSEDKQAAALINLENMSGSHTICWEWVTPAGDVYLATDHHPLTVSEGNYLPKLSSGADSCGDSK